MDRPDRPVTSAVFAPVSHAIASRLHARSEATAIRFRGTSISNGALLHKVSALVASMDASGVGNGTRVGSCLTRSPLTLALLLALWQCGAVYVPLDPALPRERLLAMCEVAELELLIAEADLQGICSALPYPVLLIDGNFDSCAQPRAPVPASEAPLDPDTLAYILFTSGSSGVPKGVKISHGNLGVFFAAAQTLLRLGESCRVLGCANFCFDIALFELLAPLLCGGTLVMADDQECAAPAQLVALVAQEQVTVVQATPSHWQLLTALPWPVRIATALSIGEALLRDTAAAILRNADALWNLYGPTECTIWSSAHQVTLEDLHDKAAAIVSIGNALPGYTLELERVEQDDGTMANELVISGDAVGLGYCADAHDSGFASTPVARRYRSGDLCRCDARGLLHYSGRRDNQAKHNGYRIEPDEIALLLRQHMSIRQAACLVRPASASSPSLLFACVAFRPGMPNRSKKELNAYLATSLPHWMLPQRYLVLDELPLNANGKLDRAALLALTTPARSPVPQDDLAGKVSAVFREVLDIDQIGPCDSFLDAGGSSMLVATLVMTLNERLGTSLTLRRALATPPTVSSIVQLLDTASLRQAS